MPRHSIIIPVLNGAAHVKEALASALIQLGMDDEIIVVDNGSTDATQQILQTYADGRIRMLSEARRGPAAARNTGVRAARGELISFLDHDDLWPPERQRGLVAALAANPAANAAYGRVRMQFDDGPDPNFDNIDGQHAPQVAIFSFMFRRALLESVGPMDETLLFGEDTDYFPRLQAGGMISAIYEGDAAIYRRHATNMTHDRGAVADAVLQVMARNIARRRNQKP